LWQATGKAFIHRQPGLRIECVELLNSFSGGVDEMHTGEEVLNMEPYGFLGLVVQVVDVIMVGLRILGW
jgi:hypothetical protein